MALATWAKTGTFAPACSRGAISFFRRKSPTASGLPAIDSRRTSFADSSIKARLMVNEILVGEPNDIFGGNNAQGLGAELLRIEVVMEPEQDHLVMAH